MKITMKLFKGLIRLNIMLHIEVLLRPIFYKNIYLQIKFLELLRVFMTATFVYQTLISMMGHISINSTHFIKAI